ncbi:MAG TPA: hypothetical protein VII06_27430 [Chloroflexota bacterium]
MNPQFTVRTWRRVLAVVGATTMSLALTTAAFAWPGGVEGRPAGFHPGAPGDYYVWHTDNDVPHWHVETTDLPGFNHVYTGTLTTDGQFVGVDVAQPEADDWIRQVGPGTIQYQFHTFSGIDGVRFDIAGGSYLSLDLGRDGHPSGLDRIHLGATGLHPASNPVVLPR